MIKRRKRKIPKKAVKPLMQTCEMLSEEWKKPAKDIFKRFLKLMNRYADYFFSQPWPAKYDYEKATTFTDEDIEFLSEGESEEFPDRYTTLCLKKNINLEHGFMGYFGMFWTQQAFHEKFVRPMYKPVEEAFEEISEDDKNPHIVLNKLKEKFSIKLIHDSLVDLVEHEYLDPMDGRLVAGILELLHKEEKLPPCNMYRCKLKRETLHENKDR